MSKIEKIEAIAVKAAATLTNLDKAYITKLSKEMGVEFTPRPHCPNCYSDQAIILRKLLKEEECQDTDAAYVLRAGCDVIFNGIRVCKDTITDELAEKLIEMGFNKKFFSKCK